MMTSKKNKQRPLRRKSKTAPRGLSPKKSLTNPSNIEIQQSPARKLNDLKWIKTWWGQLGLLTVSVIAIYGHTLDVPFYMDDYSSIKENVHIQNLSDFEQIFRVYKIRAIGYLSFALNYHFHGSDPAGYHVVNITIHWLAAIAVWVLGKALLMTPAIRSSEMTLDWVPFLAAMIFLIHPLQTQAVTYTVQRLASMSAMFYIWALAFYVKGRCLFINGMPKANKSFGLVFTTLCLILAGLAFLTKQNTYTLPMAMVFIEIIFFKLTLKRTLGLMGLLVMILGAIWWGVCITYKLDPFAGKSFLALSKMGTQTPRDAYFLTQMKVLWLYLKLYFWPFGYAFEYDVQLVKGISDWQAILALAGHVGVLTISLSIFKRFPLVSFGIGFYYLAHTVESGFFPIRDLCFEHRTYLPNMGLSFLLGGLLINPLSRFINKYVLGGGFLVFCLIMGGVTFQRNQVWRNPIALWTESAGNAPNVYRPWNELGKHLLREGRYREAEGALLKAMTVGRSADASSASVKLKVVTMINYLIVLGKLEQYEKALQITEDILRQRMAPIYRSKLLNNKGSIYWAQNKFALAENTFREAVTAHPDNVSAMINLGRLLAFLGRFPEARQLFGSILIKDPGNEMAHHNLAKIAKIMDRQNRR